MVIHSLPDAEHIRLFRIKSYSESSRLSLTTSIHPLRSAPPFDAISFTSRGTDNGVTVECDQEDISAPSGLAECLLQLREEGRTGALYWGFILGGGDYGGGGHGSGYYRGPDPDKPELNIAAIFARAAKTICWLGPQFVPSESLDLSKKPSRESLDSRDSDDDSDQDSNDNSDDALSTPTQKAFSMIPLLVAAHRQALGYNSRSSSSAGTMSSTNILTRLSEYRHATKSISRKRWGALNELLSQRYFSRSWVLIELLCARNLVLQCGPLEASWDDVCFALEGCDLYKCPSVIKSDGLQMLLSTQTLRRVLSRGLPPQPRFLAQLFVALDESVVQASVAWEKIVGANSISQHLYGSHFVGRLDSVKGDNPNFALASVSLNETLGRPFTLSLVESGEKRDPAAPPSWVPNWGKARDLLLLDSPDGYFRASAVAQQHEFVFLPSSTTPEQFKFTGVIIDTVRLTAKEGLGPRRCWHHYSPTGANACTIISEWWELAQENTPGYDPWAGNEGPVSAEAHTLETNTLQKFAETIQARGCSWKFAAAMPFDDDKRYTALARQFLDFFFDEDGKMDESDEIRVFYAACYPSHGRRFGVTSGGRFCLLPSNARARDIICIPYGSKVPVVLRKEVKTPYYRNLGESYVHGLMHGQMKDVADLVEMSFEVD